ncbi:MAG TPA: CheR family methyltransferase [Polyangiaceae bacterium]|nr:CheR family methyltransferase [Polyangiaceae bacterium]
MNLESFPEDADIERFTELVYRHFNYDFRNYARASLRRRLARAMLQFGFARLAELEALLLETPEAFGQVLQYLTVQVSDMFRDPNFFRAFREHVVPELGTYPSPRLWVAGCATGEEVLSIAIVLREEGLLERCLIYATDISPEALRKAQLGVYALDRVAAFTENHQKTGAACSLSAYYTAAYGGVAFDRSLTKRVVFSDHSLATDHVFAEVQVVLCRNVLIYFDKTLQARALGLFTDALSRRGFLGLGSKETLAFTGHAQAYRRVVPDEPWYRRC